MQCLYIVFPGHTNMSDMPENPMVDAKIMNLLLFCPKLYELFICSFTNEGHLGFCRHLPQTLHGQYNAFFRKPNILRISVPNLMFLSQINIWF